MVDFINRERRLGDGAGPDRARHTGGPTPPPPASSRRSDARAASVFRPIVLTSLTTFVGLIPMMADRSLQAAFFIPMAVSLAFGVMFATFVTLLLVPIAYLVLDDLQRLPRRLLALLGGTGATSAA